jgi:site-specific DNA-methyltransferase (adenine-specific)
MFLMIKPYFSENQIKLFLGNSLSILKQFEDNSFDMIFADPPYFLSNGGISCKNGKIVKVNKADWDKSNGFENDFAFNYSWLKQCQRILKPTGTIWITGTKHNIFMIGTILQQLEFNILNDIIWFKPNAPPNLSCKFFTHSHETLLWARKNKNISHKFNYSVSKLWESSEDIFKNEEKQMRSVWSIPLTPPREKQFGKHPTQKPLELLKRIILTSTNENDLVLDPFNGSGTTGVICKKFNRKYIGIDLEKEYLELSKIRLSFIMN